MTQQQIVTGVVGFGVVLLIAGFIYDDQPKRGPQPLAERCSELGGEWIYKSADLLCLMPDGNKLSYSAAEDGFIPYTGSGGVVAVAQASTGERQPVGSCSSTPSFDDYQTNQSFNGRAKVDFSTNEAATHYRTAITKDVTRGVNFAGKYVVSTWGCGEGCQGSAVINGETGKILSYGMTSTGYEFDVNSRLLDAEKEGYFVVEDDSLKELCK
jgi:hypothetical protein